MRQIQLNNLNRQSNILRLLLIYYWKLTKDFFKSTALNGLKYLTFKYLNLWERLFFLGCFIAAFYGSYYFAMNIVEKWKTSSVMSSRNPKTTLIMEEPFPAITICNMNQAQYSKVKDFDKNSLNYAMLQKLCFQEINYTSFAHLKNQRSKNDTFVNFIVKNKQPCNDMLEVCYYGNLKRTCSDLFREMFLDEGMCCSFNIVHPFLLHKGYYNMLRDYTSTDHPSMPLDWNLEKGYPNELPEDFYPRTPLGDGISGGLTIILNGDLDNYYCSSTNGPGFKVSFHNPIETPHVKEIGLYLALGYHTTFRITPIKEESSRNLLLSTKPKERQCYFNDEYPLYYFRYYTQLNCEMECDARFMMRKCNCLQYHMPDMSKNITECNVEDFDCVVEVEKDYEDQTRLACKRKCLSNCNTLTYEPNAFLTALDNNGFAIRNPFLRNMSKDSLKKYAVLQIFFPDNYYRGNVKNPNMSFKDLLSQVGGVMGLMMGFSVMSLVEMAYFFVIRPIKDAWLKVFRTNKILATS